MEERSTTQHHLTPPILDLISRDDMDATWGSWFEKWEDYKVVTELSKKAMPYQCSMLRYCFSDTTRSIYKSLDLSNEERLNPDSIVQALHRYVDDSVNIPRNR